MNSTPIGDELQGPHVDPGRARVDRGVPAGCQQARGATGTPLHQRIMRLGRHRWSCAHWQSKAARCVVEVVSFVPGVILLYNWHPPSTQTHAHHPARVPEWPSTVFASNEVQAENNDGRAQISSGAQMITACSLATATKCTQETHLRPCRRAHGAVERPGQRTGSKRVTHSCAKSSYVSHKQACASGRAQMVCRDG